MPTEQEVEDAINARGLNAPRLSPRLIDATIRSEWYAVVPGTSTTICALTLANGYTVIGKSACASLENFNEDIGRSLARERAREQIWELEGYLLRDRIARATGACSEAQSSGMA